MANPVTKFEAHPPSNRTLASQDKLPKLPIPPLEDTCRRYLTALEGLQDAREHEQTVKAVKEFLEGEGPTLQKRLQEWAETKARYVQYHALWWEVLIRHLGIVTSKTSGE